MRLVIDTTEIEAEAYRAIKDVCEAYLAQPAKKLQEINAIIERFKNLINEAIAYGKKCE